MFLAIPIALVVCVAAIGYVFELPKALGAHPFWSDQVLWIGVPIGLILGSVSLRLPYAVRNLCLFGLAILSSIAVYWGKLTFAASFAENTLAGRAWYYGWICVITFSAGLLLSLASRKKALPS